VDNPNNSPKGVLQVLFLASEACPLIKVGGLADVAGSLPLALRALDPQVTGGYLLDVRLAIPFHGAIKVPPADVTPVTNFNVMKNGQPVEARVFLYEHNGLPIYLIAGDPIPPEATVYSMNTAVDGDKYIFFSLAALQLARALNWQPDVIHANDWHAAATVYALELEKQTDAFFANTHTLLCVHNLPFMGAGTANAVAAYGLPPSDDPDLPDWGRMFPLVMGLSKAEQIVTVSPSYAREILTPEFGLGLEGFLRTRAGRLKGILNGLDQNVWHPARDTALAQPFSADSLERRAENKKALQAEFGLPVSEETPLLIMISRMEHQKGVDLLVEGLRLIADQGWQCILLGSGDPKLENDCRRLEADLPARVRAAVRFDPSLSRHMYAGADILMMPSRYEPCGIAQMVAMHYGCIPVASAVGGLRDTIIDLPDQPARSTGFLFNEISGPGLAGGLRRALAEFARRDPWRERQRCAMQQDFSWERSAIEYSQIYTKWRNKE
jgi:starch synthase